MIKTGNIWRTIKSCSGLYEASIFGEIRRLNGRVIKQCKDKDGYLHITTCVKGRRKTERVSRLVAIAFIKNPQRLPFVLHINDIITDNRVVNLRWGTPKDNMQDAIKKKRIPTLHQSIHAKPIYQYSLKGVFLKEWSSRTQASNETKTDKSCISSCVAGRMKTAGGFIWLNNKIK